MRHAAFRVRPERPSLKYFAQVFCFAVGPFADLEIRRSAESSNPPRHFWAKAWLESPWMRELTRGLLLPDDVAHYR